jgi:homoserine dehydrogenase
VKIVFAGFGTVVKNVVTLLLKRELSRSLPFKVVAIVDSRGAAISREGLDLAEATAWKEAHGIISRWTKYGLFDTATTDILEEVSPDLLVETTPTNIDDGDPGPPNISSALSRGIDVITRAVDLKYIQ